MTQRLFSQYLFCGCVRVPSGAQTCLDTVASTAGNKCCDCGTLSPFNMLVSCLCTAEEILRLLLSRLSRSSRFVLILLRCLLVFVRPSPPFLLFFFFAQHSGALQFCFWFQPDRRRLIEKFFRRFGLIVHVSWQSSCRTKYFTAEDNV